MKGRGTRWKAVVLDYDVLSLYSDDDDCTVCLTPRQAAALLGYMRGMNWKTRWDNLPDDFDLKAWVNDIEGRLINVSCNCDNQCLCELTNAVTELLALQQATELVYPVIPPNDPSQNLPPLQSTDPDNLQRRDAAICDFAKLYIDQSFEAMYRYAVAYCQNNQKTAGLDTNRIVGGLGLALGALGVTASGPIVAALAGASFLLGVNEVGDEIITYIEDSLESGDGDCNDIQRYPAAVRNAYGCQLARAMLDDITYNSWKTAFDQPDPLTTAQMQGDGIPVFWSAQIDLNVRVLLQSFVRSGDGFQSFINALSSLADDLYYEAAICPGCFPLAPGVLIDPFDGVNPYVESITPAPTIVGAEYQWAGGDWSPIVIRFNQPVGLDLFDMELVRGVVQSEPSAFEFKANFLSVNSNVGGSGPNELDAQLSSLGVTRTLILSARDTSSENALMRLEIPALPLARGLIVRPVQ